MAQARTDALIDSWKTKANLSLSAEEEQKVIVLFIHLINTILLFCHLYISSKHGLVLLLNEVNARREAGKEVMTQLQAAVENNDSAKAEELLQKVRGGLRQLSEGRESALDEFDKILKPEQRARIVVYAVQQAKESGSTSRTYDR